MDPDSFNPDPDPAFQVNPDLDPIRIQGFDDQKLKKKIQLKFINFFFIFVGHFCPPGSGFRLPVFKLAFFANMYLVYMYILRRLPIQSITVSVASQ